MSTELINDDFKELLIDKKQYEFKMNIIKILQEKAKTCKNISIMQHEGKGKGKVYADFVITIKSTETYDSIEVYRNRTGTLIMAIEKTKNVSFNWEYIFVENHIKKLIKNSIK